MLTHPDITVAPAALAPDVIEGGTELRGRVPRTQVGPRLGWPSLVWIAGFLSIAASMFAMKAGFGIVPFAAASALVVAGIVIQRRAGLRDAARKTALLRMYPREPWRWDYPWDERGIDDDYTAVCASRDTRIAALLALFALGCGGGLIYLLMRPEPLDVGHAIALAFIGGIGLLAGPSWIRIARRARDRQRRYGTARAAFESFPFRKGRELGLRVLLPPALAPDAGVTATVRCVQERLGPRLMSDRASRSLRCFEVYRDSAAVRVVRAGTGGRAFHVTFDIPVGVPSTNMTARHRRYWEVELEAGDAAVNYGAFFLVPVY